MTNDRKIKMIKSIILIIVSRLVLVSTTVNKGYRCVSLCELKNLLYVKYLQAAIALVSTGTQSSTGTKKLKLNI